MDKKALYKLLNQRACDVGPITLASVAKVIVIQCRYIQGLPEGMRKLDGIWKDPVWVVAADREPEARALLMDLIGHDGERCDQVSLALHFDPAGTVQTHKPVLSVLGEGIAYGRRGGVQVMDHVEIVHGTVSQSGPCLDRCLTFAAPQDRPGKVHLQNIARVQAEKMRMLVESRQQAPEFACVRAVELLQG